MSRETEPSRRNVLRTMGSAAAMAGGIGSVAGSATADDHYDPGSGYCYKDEAGTSGCGGLEFSRWDRVEVKTELELRGGEVKELPGMVGLSGICSEPQGVAQALVRAGDTIGYVPTGAKGIVLDACANCDMYLVKFYGGDCTRTGHIHQSFLEDASGGSGEEFC